MIKSRNLPERLRFFYKEASQGSLQACYGCPRNPSDNKTSFASSCPDHSGTKRPLFLLVFRDPGGKDGGAATTSQICPFHNYDKTALRIQSFLEEFRVPLSQVHFANAVMHGIQGKNKKPNKRELVCCSSVLKGIIDILTPEVIIAFGIEASESVFKIMELGVNYKFGLKEMVKQNFYLGNRINTHVFSLPHPAFGAVNLSAFGIKENEAWKNVIGQLSELGLIKEEG